MPAWRWPFFSLRFILSHHAHINVLDPRNHNPRHKTCFQRETTYIKAARRVLPRRDLQTQPDTLRSHRDESRRFDPSWERELKEVTTELPFLHGVPILLKDLISTKDKLSTTAGSLALLGSVVRRDAGVVKRLRESGAVILGKASLSEWAHFRSFDIPSGWSARGLQGKVSFFHHYIYI